MATFNDFGNTAEQIKAFCSAGCDPLSAYQTKMVENHLVSLGSNVSHQLYMAVIESQDPKVFEAVKLIANKMGVNLDVERLSLLVKGD